MNEQAQRIAIATFCGWQAIELRDSIKSGKKDWLSGLNPNPDKIVKVIDLESGEERAPNESDYGYETLPDYLHDLNAIHVAEMVMETERPYAAHAYPMEIAAVILRRAGLNPAGHCGEFRKVSCDASVKSEALLRVIGEWSDQ